MKNKKIKRCIITLSVLVSIVGGSIINAKAKSIDPPIVNSPKMRTLQMEKLELRK